MPSTAMKPRGSVASPLSAIQRAGSAPATQSIAIEFGTAPGTDDRCSLDTLDREIRQDLDATLRENALENVPHFRIVGVREFVHPA